MKLCRKTSIKDFKKDPKKLVEFSVKRYRKTYELLGKDEKSPENAKILANPGRIRELFRNIQRAG